MDEDSEFRDAIKLGFRRAGLHWMRASYEVVAGVGAFLDELAQARKKEPDPEHDDPDEDGPVRIDID